MAGNTLSNPTVVGLLIALLVLVLVGVLTAAIFLYLRRQRKQIALRESLPQYSSNRPPSAGSMHARLSPRPASDYFSQEKKEFFDSSDAPPPPSPVPEIRVTLPEEMDEEGKAKSGRVVVVHVGDTTVGFEPYDGKIQYYQESEADRFQSLDLQRIGGLKEKEYM